MSYSPPPPPPPQFGQYGPGPNSYILQPDPILTAAGQQFIGHYSQDFVNNTGGWIDRNLRPLFAVDDSYVIRKLGFILFPFIRKTKWINNGGNELPKENVVQPDLYIPLMSFMTYVLAAGYFLGFKGQFSPEQLGILSSSALICLTLEVGLMVILFSIFNVRTCYSFLHYIAFSGYKFVPITTAMLLSLLFKNVGYYATIGYTTLSLGYYFIKSFHVAIEASNHENFNRKVSRTGIYIVGLFSLLQPLVMFWLSYHLVP